MNLTQLLVTVLGLAAIAWVNWYFFLAPSPATAAAIDRGVQRVPVRVEGGYSPAIIRVRAGHPVRLEFFRADSGSCTEEVVLGDFGIKVFLPTGQTTPVEFTPRQPGSYEFACGMGMVRGKVIAE